MKLYNVEWSVDVAILVRGLTREMKHSILERVAEIELACLFPIALLVLSEEEFDNLKKRERRIAVDIDREGDSVMREGNKRENVREETDRAGESMRAADLLFKNGFIRDAVAKLYLRIK